MPRRPSATVMQPALAAVALLLPLLSLAAPALAGTSPPGVNLRWDQCFGDGGAWNKDFACNINTGFEQLVASFELSSTFTDISGLQVEMDLGSVSPAWPAWWQFKNAGTCRFASLNMVSSQLVPSANCSDWSTGQATGGIGAYQIGSDGPNRTRIQLVSAVPASALATLDPGQEYFAFALTISHAKTVGTGSCDGCAEPMCIFLSGVRLLSPNSVGAVATLNRGANYSGSQYVTWQHGYPLNITHGCGGQTGGGIFCQYQQTNFDCVLYNTTGSRGSTWATVKSLYR